MSRALWPWTLMLAPMLALACVDTGDHTPTAPSVENRQQTIVNGTREPSSVFLTEGEKLAIGWLHQAGFPGANFCTGTVIAPRIVVTASHCTEGNFAANIGFGVGLFPSQALASVGVAQIHNHPFRDAAILVLSEDITQRVRELRPITPNRADMGSWGGRTVEASGYGDTRGSNPDGRWFVSLLLESVTGESAIVNGQGQRGICFGDSGGPLLGTENGKTMILAVESSGDESCVGRDWMTRLDAITGWMDPITGPIDPDPEPDPQPDFNPDPNPSPTPQPDQAGPCGGLDFLGRCNGDLLEWCQSGEVVRRDCASLGTSCRYLNDQIGHVCDCGGVTATGRCNGNIAEFCDGGRLAQVDCAARGQACGFIETDPGYYYCTSNPTCGEVSAQGTCIGSAVVSCANGQFLRQDCAQMGGACSTGADGKAICVGGNPNGDVAPPPNGGIGFTDDEPPTPGDPLLGEGEPDPKGAVVCTAAPGGAPGTPGPLAWTLVLIGLIALRRP